MIAPYQTALSPREKIEITTEHRESIACLVLREGFSKFENGRAFPLETSPFVIGRARSCQLIIDMTEVSRQHAALIVEGGQVFVADLNSANGTFLNGQPLASGERRRLRAGDRISLGTVCGLELDDPGETDQMLPIVLTQAQSGLTLDEGTSTVS